MSVPITVGTHAPSRRRQVWTFMRHFLEMLAAMTIGMAVLYPAWLLAGGGDRAIEIELLVMATTMSVPMIAWMGYRGHRARPTAEMAGAMYAGFVVLFPFLWVGLLDAMDVMMLGHVLMIVFMLGAMLARRGEYSHC